jgi:ADP-heptose:LPS heptosyltransferase
MGLTQIIKDAIFGKYKKKQPKIIDNPQEIFPNAKKILLLRQDRIGDVLVTIPFLKVLKENKTDLQIHILLGKKNIQTAPFIKNYCNKIWFYNKNIKDTIKLIKELNRENFDLIIDLFDNPSQTSSLLLTFLHSQFKVGIEKENLKQYTHIVPMKSKTEVHIVERIVNLLLPFGINPEGLSLEISLDSNLFATNVLLPKENYKVLGINLSGSSPAKNWGVENYITFINLIAKKYSNIKIIVFASSNLKEQQEEICIKSNATPVPITSSLIEFVGMLKQCDFILTPDTSVVHFCAAFKIPAIVLFSVPEIPPKLKIWTPYNSVYKAILTTRELNMIKPSEVLIKFEELFGE